MYKILYVSPNGYLGGAEKFVLTAALSHKKNNELEASILFFSQGEASVQAQNLGINCFFLKQRFRLRNPINLILALLEVRKIVKSYNPDVLHLTMPYSHIVLSLATVFMGIKKIWFQHGPVGGRLDQLANIFPVEMIWYNSEDLKKRHHLTWPKPIVRNSEHVINLGVQSNENNHEIFCSEKLKIGTAGRICSWKGFHLMIQALGELKKENIKSSYHFTIAGDAKNEHDKKYREELGALVRYYNLEEEVEFLKHVEKMEQYYLGLDLFIHSSVIPEPFGLVVAEAMACGCFVIGSNSGGVSDILKNGKTGISFTSTSEEALIELKKILSIFLRPLTEEEKVIYRKWALAGKKLIKENYSIEGMNKNMEKLYLELIKTKS